MSRLGTRDGMQLCSFTRAMTGRRVMTGISLHHTDTKRRRDRETERQRPETETECHDWLLSLLS